MIYQSLEELPHSHYNLIYADPPWKQSKGGKKAVRKNSSGTALDYPTCSLDEIKAHLKAVTDISAGGVRFCSSGRLTNTFLRHSKSPRASDISSTPE